MTHNSLLRNQNFKEVLPVRINAGDQINLVFPGATFDLLFSGDRVFNPVSGFEIDELVHIVKLRKPLYILTLVLENPANQIIGDTGIKNGIAHIGHYVNTGHLIFVHLRPAKFAAQQSDSRLLRPFVPLRVAILLAMTM